MADHALVRVDVADDQGPLTRLWQSIGFDELNWTATPTGRGLLARFGELGPFHVRSHYVFCSGTGLGMPHWGSGNVYHEGPDGQPWYDFTIVDQVYDAVVGAGHHVLVELGFTPRDLLPDEAAELTVPDSPTVYSSYEAGAWAYPPRDLDRWADLVAALVRHCRERYGDDVVRQWQWELWNEPDIFYWRGTAEQFHQLYAVTCAAVRAELPDAVVGGPAVTGGGAEFLRGFLTFVAEQELPLDFVSFHTKGSAFSPWRVYGATGGPAPEPQSPSTPKMITEISALLDVVAGFDRFRGLPMIIDECDAGVPAHFGAYDNANYGFQNTEYFAVFQAKLMKEVLDLADRTGMSITQATSWSFYFEGERWFEGTRAFLTAGGTEKPVLNAYRMLARLGRRRVAVTSDAAVAVPDQGLMPETVDALASVADDGTVAVLVWRHADDQYATAPALPVTVELAGLAATAYHLEQWRIDADHSNAHTVWQALGSPQDPTPEQVAQVHARQGLEPSAEPVLLSADATVELSLTLPSVALLVLTPDPSPAP